MHDTSCIKLKRKVLITAHFSHWTWLDYTGSGFGCCWLVKIWQLTSKSISGLLRGCICNSQTSGRFPFPFLPAHWEGCLYITQHNAQYYILLVFITELKINHVSRKFKHHSAELGKKMSTHKWGFYVVTSFLKNRLTWGMTGHDSNVSVLSFTRPSHTCVLPNVVEI